MQLSCAVALAGRDRWLRPKLAERLARRGLDVRGIGSGAATVRGYDALVYVPPMMPSADIGSSQARLTFAAAAEGKVSRVIVLSRVGPDKAGDPYLDALRRLEASAALLSSSVTIVRAAHPIGPPDDPGPVAHALGRAAPPEVQPTVQPVALEDLLDVVEAAVEGRIGAGVVEVGGPAKMPLSALSGLLSVPAEAVERRRLLAAFRPGRQKTPAATERFLALDSVPAPRLASPLGAPARRVVA